jgi:NTP pyrophosphatase (non-canonical NTP hydrolase)
MQIKRLCQTAHEESRRNGWYDTPNGERRNLGEMLMLMVSEAAEMLEAHRKRDENGRLKMSEKIPEFTKMEEEAADLLIRLADFSEYEGLRLEEAVSAKLAFNRTRGYRHGNLVC